MEIAPILTYLLYSVSNLSENNIGELRLAIELHALLTINCLKNKGPSRGPDVGGGNPDVGSKRRDGGPGSSGAREHGRQSPPQRGAHGSVQAGELLPSPVPILISLV